MARRAKGEGSLYQDKSGNWIYQYKEDGKRKTKRFHRKSEAKIFIDEQAQVSTVRPGFAATSHPCSTGVTVESWMKTWLETYARPSIKLSTYASYEQYIRGHIIPQLGTRLMSELKPVDVQAFFNDRAAHGHHMEEKGLSPKTLTNLRNMMHLAFDQAVNEGYIARNIIEDVRLPKMSKQEMRVLDRKEQERIIFSAQLSPEPSAFGVVFAMFTGLRLGELCALKWENVDMEKKLIYVQATRNRLPNFDESIEAATSVVTQDSPKTDGSRRSVPLMARLYQDFVKYRESQMQIMEQYPGYNSEGYVFCQDNGQPYEPRTYMDVFQRCVKRAAIPRANFHCLRHTFATRSLEQGIDVATVAKIMGHSDPSVTLKKYAHALPDHKQDSVEKLNVLYSQNEEFSAVSEGPSMVMTF